MAKTTDTSGLRTVNRALDILECFSLEEPELLFTEITEKIGLAKSTVSRMVATLESAGYLTKNGENNKYRLGKKLLFLGMAASQSSTYLNGGQKAVDELNQTYSQYVALFYKDDNRAICVYQRPSPMDERLILATGSATPLGGNLWGQVMQAYLDHEDMPDETREAIKERGYAYRSAVDVNDITGIAVALTSDGGEVIGSLYMEGPLYRFPANLEEVAKMMIGLGRNMRIHADGDTP